MYGINGKPFYPPAAKRTNERDRLLQGKKERDANPMLKKMIAERQGVVDTANMPRPNVWLPEAPRPGSGFIESVVRVVASALNSITDASSYSTSMPSSVQAGASPSLGMGQTMPPCNMIPPPVSIPSVTSGEANEGRQLPRSAKTGATPQKKLSHNQARSKKEIRNHQKKSNDASNVSRPPRDVKQKVIHQTSLALKDILDSQVSNTRDKRASDSSSFITARKVISQLTDLVSGWFYNEAEPDITENAYCQPQPALDLVIDMSQELQQNQAGDENPITMEQDSIEQQLGQQRQAEDETLIDTNYGKLEGKKGHPLTRLKFTKTGSDKPCISYVLKDGAEMRLLFPQRVRPGERDCSNQEEFGECVELQARSTTKVLSPEATTFILRLLDRTEVVENDVPKYEQLLKSVADGG